MRYKIGRTTTLFFEKVPPKSGNSYKLGHIVARATLKTPGAHNGSIMTLNIQLKQTNWNKKNNEKLLGDLQETIISLLFDNGFDFCPRTKNKVKETFGEYIKEKKNGKI